MPEPDNCIPWVLNPADCDDEWAGLDPGLQERAEALAWSSMRTLTAGQIGSCPVLMRPCDRDVHCACQDDCGYPTPASPQNPMIADGHWWYVDQSRCDACAVCEVVLPGKIADVKRVSINGVWYLPADNIWRIDNHNRVVRTDGSCWPKWQNLKLPLTQDKTFGVEYVPGRKPGLDGLWATATLASEFARACSGGKCRLPSNVTSIARQGVNMTFSEGYFENGTGIREVDAYVYSVNPNRLKVPPRIWSPDQPVHRYVDSDYD